MSDPTRRQFTHLALRFVGGVVLLAACGDSSKDSTRIAGDSDDPADTGGTGGTTTSDPSAWATGGTAAMSGNYANPFGTIGSCALICEMTEGPCYADTPARQDISEGIDGLPVRLMLRIVDTACAVVPGAVVEVWHAAPNGLYSGEEAQEMCTDGDAEAMAASWFRGSGTTDSDGIVFFDTCFPGWYSGRAIHIHVRVLRGGQSYAVAQLFFDASLISEVYTQHVVYAPRGEPDTPNSADSILGENDPEPYLLDHSQQADGAMLAWKTLTIRASLSEDTCTAADSSGGGPP